MAECVVINCFQELAKCWSGGARTAFVEPVQVRAKIPFQSRWKQRIPAHMIAL